MYKGRGKPQDPTQIVLAMVFATPSSRVAKELDDDGDLFDCRSGKRWDIFFPGYFTSKDPSLEENFGSRRLGASYGADWYFNPSYFVTMREKIEQECSNRWIYSGQADLVLINVMMRPVGEPIVDWESARGGQLTNVEMGDNSLTLGEVVARISKDLEDGFEDADFGVSQVINPDSPALRGSAGRDVAVAAGGSIIAAVVTKFLLS